MTLSGIVGLHASCLRLLPNKHMIRMIMVLVRNRRFTLTTGGSKQSSLRHLKSGVPLGLVSALLFSTFIYSIYVNICRPQFLENLSKQTIKHNNACMRFSGNWKTFKRTLNQNMIKHFRHLQTQKK